jgi:hypothetical protein
VRGSPRRPGGRRVHVADAQGETFGVRGICRSWWPSDKGRTAGSYPWCTGETFRKPHCASPAHIAPNAAENTYSCGDLDRPESHLAHVQLEHRPNGVSSAPLFDVGERVKSDRLSPSLQSGQVLAVSLPHQPPGSGDRAVDQWEHPGASRPATNARWNARRTRPATPHRPAGGAGRRRPG